MNLSKNFTLSELIEAGSAHRLGYAEQFTPSKEVIAHLQDLCIHVLQPLRDHFNHPIHVDSGYRCERVNKAVGGAKNSDHLYGYAADIQLTVDGKNCNQQIYDAVIKLGLPFRQMIDEFGTETEPAWIHISYNPKDNKKEKLRARKINGKTQYTLI